MQRNCNGTDPNLRQHRHANGDRCIAPGCEERVEEIPCDCGLQFDDIDRMVIYPHLKFAKAKPDPTWKTKYTR